jgi:hypothetical protein
MRAHMPNKTLYCKNAPGAVGAVLECNIKPKCNNNKIVNNLVYNTVYGNYVHLK